MFPPMLSIPLRSLSPAPSVLHSTGLNSLSIYRVFSTTFSIFTTCTSSATSASFFSVLLSSVQLLFLNIVEHFSLCPCVFHICDTEAKVPKYAIQRFNIFQPYVVQYIFQVLRFYLGFGLNSIPSKIKSICFFDSEQIEIFFNFFKYSCQNPLWLF